MSRFRTPKPRENQRAAARDRTRAGFFNPAARPLTPMHPEELLEALLKRTGEIILLASGLLLIPVIWPYTFSVARWSCWWH